MAAAQDPVAIAQDPLVVGHDPVVVAGSKASNKIDWLQVILFIFSLLCFTGAAILWMHSS